MAKGDSRLLVRTIPSHRQQQMSPPDLAALVQHYQTSLRLLDWRIDVSYARDLCDHAGNAVWGLCYPVADAKVAKIIIRDPATPPEGASPDEALRQITETVVHELVHLHFAPFGNRAPAAIVAEEQAVWALAEALVQAKGTEAEQNIARSMVARIHGAARLVGTNIQPLRAATGDSAMTLAEFMAAAKALGFDDDASLDEVQAKLKGEPAKEEEPASEELPPAAAEVPPPAATEEEKPAEAIAAVARLVAAFGKTDVAETVSDALRCRAIAVDLEKREAKLAKDQAVLDGAEIRRIVGELVKRGTIGVSIAWGDEKGTVPAEQWLGMGVVGMRAMLAKSPATARTAGPKPPAADDDLGLTEYEVAMCKRRKIDPAKYAASPARIHAVTKTAGADR
jgi:hypothetical protein